MRPELSSSSFGSTARAVTRAPIFPGARVTALSGRPSARGAAHREVREKLGVLLTDPFEELGVFGGSSLYTVDYPGWGPTTYEVTMFATISRRRSEHQDHDQESSPQANA